MSGEAGYVNRETLRKKVAKGQDHDKGDERRWGCSSLGVWEWWLATRNSHCVEISITGGVGEMVRDPNPSPVFFAIIF